jgi:ABC-2 type transport system ATP-binding protein
VTAVVEVNRLSKRYRAHDPLAVDGVSFALEPGQAFGLLGPNGAGKSTIVKAIVGLTRPTKGRINLFGSNPGDASARSQVGFAPEGAVHDLVPEGRTLEQVFMDLVASSSPAPGLPGFMSDEPRAGSLS